MMKKLLIAVGILVSGASCASAQSVIAQFGPTTEYSTIDCANFSKAPDGAWRALDRVLFGLGFVHKIVPPATPIKVGGWIYNNIDLYSQLELQCGGGAFVRARY